MRARHPRALPIALASAVLIAASCALAPSPATDITGSAKPSPSATVAPTALATAAPSTLGVVPADVIAANTTPWLVRSVEAGTGVCAIDATDAVRCWGATRQPAPEGRYLEVDPGPDDTCAIRLDGTLDCWGDVTGTPPTGTFTALDSAGQDRCAIRSDGRLACWRIPIGDDPEADGASSDPLPEGRFTQLVMSEYRRPCALRDDGTVGCWGEGDPPIDIPGGPFAALGEGCRVLVTGELECFVPGITGGAELPTGPFTAMSGNPDRGCAIRADQELACWGVEAVDEVTPLRTPPGTWKTVSVSEYAACALGTDDRGLCWAYDDEAVRPAPAAEVRLPGATEGRVIDVTWEGITLAAPIRTYDVEYQWHDPLAPDRDDESEDEQAVPAWTAWLTETTERAASLETEKGGTYCVRVRPHDADGLTGSWSERCTTVPIDDRELVASPDWTPVEGEPYLLHTALRTTTKGAMLHLTGGGLGSIGILGTTCGGCGTFVIRSSAPDCGSEEESQPAASCPPAEMLVDLRGPHGDSILVVASDNGEQAFAGPVDIVVTSTGKPVIIDAVIFDIEIE